MTHPHLWRGGNRGRGNYIKTKEIDHKFYPRYVKAFEHRLIADYKVLEPILKELAKQKLQDAKEFRQEILRVLKEEERL